MAWNPRARMSRLNAVQFIAERYMRAMAVECGLSPSVPLDVSVDGPAETHAVDSRLFVITVEAGRRVVGKCQLRLPRRPSVDDNDLNLEIGTLLQRHADLSAVIAHSKLDRHFPNAIDSVQSRRNVETNQRFFLIKFKNGHRFEVLESELESDINLAKGMMVYDLPPL